MRADDFASHLEAIHNETAVVAHLAQREILTGPSAEFCQVDDCGMHIPLGRRLARPGIQRCTQCQTHREKKDRR